MTIPSAITVALASLESQVSAAEPLTNASHATIVALQLNAGNLVAAIQTALTTVQLVPNIVFSTDSLLLDAWAAPVDPQLIIAGIQNVVTASINQQQLSLMRGVVGRAASNLDQLV